MPCCKWTMSTSRCCREASRVPEDLRHRVDVDHRLWDGRHSDWMVYPSVVARLSDRVSTGFIETQLIGDPYSHDFYTSEWGTLGAAVVNSNGEDEPLTVVSMAAGGDNFTHEVRLAKSSRGHWLGASADFGSIAAGRAVEAASLPLATGRSTEVGVAIRRRSGTNARRCTFRRHLTGCEPWAFATSCPRDGADTAATWVTFKPIGLSPAEAWGQLDYVFATENIADRVSVRALNEPDEWGSQRPLSPRHRPRLRL